VGTAITTASEVFSLDLRTSHQRPGRVHLEAVLRSLPTIMGKRARAETVRAWSRSCDLVRYRRRTAADVQDTSGLPSSTTSTPWKSPKRSSSHRPASSSTRPRTGSTPSRQRSSPPSAIEIRLVVRVGGNALPARHPLVRWTVGVLPWLRRRRPDTGYNDVGRRVPYV